MRLICAEPWPGYPEEMTYIHGCQYRFMRDRADKEQIRPAVSAECGKNPIPADVFMGRTDSRKGGA